MEKADVKNRWLGTFLVDSGALSNLSRVNIAALLRSLKGCSQGL